MDKKLKEEIKNNAQFPYHRRSKQYQSIDEEGMPGIRDMNLRFSLMKLPDDMSGKSVLDIGCSLGRVCVKAHELGAARCVGLEYDKETHVVANKYMNELGYPVEILQFDVNDGLDALKELIGEEQFDYVFALSIINHVDSGSLWEIINYYTKDTLWFEHHARRSMDGTLKLLRRNTGFDNYEFLGYITDRGKRPNFKIT